MIDVEPIPMSLDIDEPPPRAHPFARRLTIPQYRAVMRAISHGMPMHEIARHANVSVSTLRQMITLYHIEN